MKLKFDALQLTLFFWQIIASFSFVNLSLFPDVRNLIQYVLCAK